MSSWTAGIDTAADSGARWRSRVGWDRGRLGVLLAPSNQGQSFTPTDKINPTQNAQGDANDIPPHSIATPFPTFVRHKVRVQIPETDRRLSNHG